MSSPGAVGGELIARAAGKHQLCIIIQLLPSPRWPVAAAVIVLPNCALVRTRADVGVVPAVIARGPFLPAPALDAQPWRRLTNEWIQAPP